MLATGILVVLLLAGGTYLWWHGTRALPESPARTFLLDSAALEFPSRPETIVALARPGRWERFLAKNPSRAVLLDPAWWQSLAAGTRHTGSPAAPWATPLLLDRLHRGLVIAWWHGAWILQAPLSSGRMNRRLGTLLPRHFAGRWRLRDGVLRVVSDPSLLSGRAWTVRPRVDPSRSPACWIWLDDSQWSGWWEDGVLVLGHGRPAEPRLPEPRGALLAHVEDGRRILDLLASHLPTGGLLEGIGTPLHRVLARPVGLWLRRLEPGSALPRPLAALALGLSKHEDGAATAAALRQLLCPLGCRTEDLVLDGGDPVRHWQSALGSWWVAVLSGDAVTAATSRTQLENLLGARGAWPGGDWAVVEAGAAADSLEAIASARLVAAVGLVRAGRLDQLRRVAEPLRGFTTIRWFHDGRGDRIELEPSPAP